MYSPIISYPSRYEHYWLRTAVLFPFEILIFKKDRLPVKFPIFFHCDDPYAE